MASSSSSSSSWGLAMAVFFLVIFSSSAAVLKVGDAVGWTIQKIDYGTWASNKTFHVGDTLLFVYNKAFHNVMEVKKSDYDGCTAASPISTQATGNDSITLKSEGDHYFLCGVPGHCGIGQKLKVTALAKGSSAAPSASPAGAPSSAPVPPSGGGPPTTGGGSGTPAASPKPSGAAVASYKGWGLVAVAAGLVMSFV